MRLLVILFAAILFLPVTQGEAAGDYPKATIAVMGGTHMNDAMTDSGYLKGQFTIETPAGESPPIHWGEVEGVPFYYIEHHGRGKWAETWGALYHLGVKEVIGGATAGGLNTYLKTYDLVLPDDLIDFNVNRPLYILPQVLGHESQITARMKSPTDPILRKILLEEARRAVRSRPELDYINVHEGGTLVQTKGGRFESAAEDHYIRQIGGDLVTINNGTEMVYARQLGINYACLNVISNPAEGIAEWEWADIKPVYQLLNPVCVEIVLAAIPRVAEIGDAPREIDTLRRMEPGFTYKKPPAEEAVEEK